MNAQPARILLATDGAAAARHATVVAAKLASAFAAELTSVHVVPAIEYRVGRLAPTLPITRHLDDPYASSALLDARRIAWNTGASSRTVLIAGEPPQAIVAASARLHADLLVIAATHRRGPVRLRTSVGRWIETHARCPVFAVPPDRATAKPGPSRPTPALSLAPSTVAACCCDGGRCVGCGAACTVLVVADRST